MENSEQSDDSGVLLIWGVTGILAAAIIAIALHLGGEREAIKDVTPKQPPGIVAVEEKPAEKPKFVEKQTPVEKTTEQKPPAGPSLQEEIIDTSEPPAFAELDSNNLPHLLSLSSSRFQEKGRLPLQHSCYRTNESPPLQWANAPKGTKSFALFMTRDSEETPYVKWVLFNIAADKHALSRNLAKTETLPDGSAQAITEHNNVGYTGPCEPKGQFRYTFRLFALDTKLDLIGGAHMDDVLRAMRNHVLDADEFPVVHFIRL